MVTGVAIDTFSADDGGGCAITGESWHGANDHGGVDSGCATARESQRDVNDHGDDN